MTLIGNGDEKFFVRRNAQTAASERSSAQSAEKNIDWINSILQNSKSSKKTVKENSDADNVNEIFGLIRQTGPQKTVHIEDATVSNPPTVFKESRPFRNAEERDYYGKAGAPDTLRIREDFLFETTKDDGTKVLIFKNKVLDDNLDLVTEYQRVDIKENPDGSVVVGMLGGCNHELSEILNCEYHPGAYNIYDSSGKLQSRIAGDTMYYAE